MTTTRLYLIRHGQVEGHDTGRINGQADAPLTPLGRAQAEAAAQRIARIPLAGVYSSDLSRSDYGARCVITGRNMSHTTFSALREMNFGNWSGKTHSQVEEMEKTTIDSLFSNLLHTSAPEGESIADVHSRVMPCLNTLLAAHTGKSLCLVAHSGVNRVILSDALCCGPELFWKLDQKYGCLNIIDYGDPKGPIVRLMNEDNPETCEGGAVL